MDAAGGTTVTEETDNNDTLITRRRCMGLEEMGEGVEDHTVTHRQS